MATPVILPRQGQSVESCIISKWHKNPGDAVAEGDLLFTYETDKATFDEYAKLGGTMLGRFFEEGDDVPCLLNVCVIGNAGEDWQQFKPVGDAPEAAPAAVEEKPAEKTETAAPAVKQAAGTSQFASPRAKALANRLGLDVTSAAATGPHGRVIERDVIAMQRDWAAAPKAETPAPVQPAAAPAAAPAYVDEPISNVRKVIAKNMQASLQNMAQLTHHVTFDATSIMNYRKQLKANAEKLAMPNITLNDMVMYAVARTLKSHRALNAHYLDDKKTMRYFTDVNLGMAVDTERGLLVPTIFAADKLTLAELAAKTKELAKSAQSGTISPDLLSGGSFTVSNLGSFDVEVFTPVINPPQTGILGVDTITTRVREVNGEIKTYPAMGLSLTYDHRALDGAPASRFLKELKTNLENFTLLLAK